MKQKNTLQWLSIVAGKTKLLVGVLVAIQAVLSVSSIAFAFVLRRIINMAVDGVRSGFWASLALLVGILLGQIVLSAAGRFLSEYTSAERLMEAEALAPDSTETVPEEQTLNFYQTELQSLQLEHVCFTYQPPVQTEGEPPAMPVVLQDVSLTVRKGEYIAFTGPSGCGKSTLLKLLMCLYPLDSGQRFLSTKTGNQPLTPAWKSLFAYVPQGNQLLSGSIRSIVAFGDEDRAQDENAIYNALKIACADDFVRRLENGLDTVLGERGAGLSEGQMQRIAIARAVYSNHPILLLDEATSALDEATALRLLNNLRKMTDKTVILVTHRMNQAGFFDAELAFSKDGICVRERKTCK